MDEIVEVYYNLHKKCLSVRHKGKVICHTPAITLRNAKFVVREGGRQRVLQEGKKNVHAFVKGELVSYDSSEHARSATYNPFKFDSFVDRETSEPVYNAELVSINGRQINYGSHND